MFVDHESIKITASGIWLSNGEAITHEETLRGFKRHLKRDDQGYYIQIGPEIKRIEVQDTAYFVERVFIEPNQIRIRLSDGTQELLGLDTLEYSPGRLICKIKGGSETAKFLSQPYHELLLLCESQNGTDVIRGHPLKKARS